MSNLFGFIDESGLLTSDPKQRFFALGLLLIDDCSVFYDQISKNYLQIVSKIEDKKKNQFRDFVAKKEKDVNQIKNLLNTKRFEYKFNRIDQSNVTDYLNVVDQYFSFTHTKFCALVIDTASPYFNFKKYFNNSWEAYIGYSKMLIKNNCNHESKICIIADFLQKPLSSNKYFEVEINKLLNIYNSCRMESDASLFIQIVDLLLGSVVYDFKLKNKIIGREKPNFPKIKVVRKIRSYLKTETLALKKTWHIPSYFSIWPFQYKPTLN